ncbi:hypothetical protein CH063_02844 [Colletotrichum higginsianum]|uniref:Uncharacterized protein n=2 Tax=Colletotrichum higginsianum TaxID=80884 RepID=H1VQG3_COLHI|nr:hypothetical protein CH63R_14249 [Colletotrichum higginsianum IMI 349063]OBR03023.1 hypothetical protein CH63R_14249 [Colletotrichum higginsianum IMI 349063]TIC90927.1 hypothetical protein CH35J_011148 [Colletotrichum higginsianum]GJD05034.1 hypothetical protein ColKHC_13859 [Colletotrichum higginsianum]CCF42469.1 hypothetical protein CH063_02844 [Colletotrichum higginsianum]
MDTAGLTVASSMVGISGDSNDTFSIPSPASRRLLWTLNGPLESAIQVAPGQYYEAGDIMEPYFHPGDADVAPSWHPVSQESLMVPQVPTVTVRIYCLDDWEQLWVEFNRYCLDTKNDPRRPRAKDVELEVTAGSGAFLTIHEYVSAVHPWLMGMRERLLYALGKTDGKGVPWPPEAKLAVTHFGSGALIIQTEDKWAYSRRKPNLEPRVKMTIAEDMEASRKVEERMLARSAARVRELERLRQENNGHGL